MISCRGLVQRTREISSSGHTPEIPYTFKFRVPVDKHGVVGVQGTAAVEPGGHRDEFLETKPGGYIWSMLW